MGRKKLEEKSENIAESKKKVTSKKAVDKSKKEKATTKKEAEKSSKDKVATKRSVSTKKSADKGAKDKVVAKKSVEKKTRSKVAKEKDNLNEDIKDNEKKEVLNKNDSLDKDLEDTKILVVDSKVYKVRIADIVAVIVSILLILFLLYEVVLYDRVNKNDGNDVNVKESNNGELEVSLNKEFRLTTEDSIDIKKLFQNGNLLGESLEVIIVNSEGKRVSLEKRYYDIDGTEVASSVALSNGKLNGGFYTKFYMGEVGTFDVTINDLDNKKEYKTKFIVEDKTKPVLVLKDVVIKVGEEVSVDDFVLSIFDNSKKDCKIEFVLNAGETLDLSEGEHKVKIKATDVYGNKTVVEARLMVVS